MSDLRTLYSTLAGKTISYTNEAGSAVNVAGVDLVNLKEEASELDTPIRLILPFEKRQGGSGSDLELLTVGTTNLFSEISWDLVDLLLHAPVGSGFRLADHLPDLIRYSGAYAELIADSGADLGIGSMTFQGLVIQVTTVEWPPESGQHFHAVEAILSYKEILNVG